MHLLDLPSSLPQVSDWWAISLSGLEQLGTALVGPLPGGWVRQGDNFVRIAGGVKYGANARKLDAELAALRVDGC